MMMKQKSLMSALILACAATGAWAAQGESAEVQSLRAECAAKTGTTQQAKAANEYQFVYYKGAYKGEQVAGKTLPCTETQYVAYLDKADPTRVMAAYPTAAGRPVAKTDAKK